MYKCPKGGMLECRGIHICNPLRPRFNASKEVKSLEERLEAAQHMAKVQLERANTCEEEKQKAVDAIEEAVKILQGKNGGTLLGCAAAAESILTDYVKNIKL